MHALQSIFFLGMGLLLLWVDWRGLQRGRLPFGSKAYFETLVYERAVSPGRFWFAFALYLCVGIGMLGYAVLLAAGAVPAVRWSR
jgi:hypothetical protein